MKNENKTKTVQVQTVINVEKNDKASFQTLKTTFNLSDKEMFAVLLEAQAEVPAENFQRLVGRVVLEKQMAKVQAKINKLEAKLNAAKAEAVVEPEVEEELETVVVIGD